MRLKHRISQMSYQEKINLLDGLTDLFNEVGPSTPKEIDEILRESGYDPAQVGKRMKAVAEKAMAKSFQSNEKTADN